MRWYKDRVILNLLKSPLHVATREHCKHDGVVWKGPYTEYRAIGGGWRVIKEGRSGTSIVSFVKGLKKENRVRASRHKEPVTLREPGYVTYHMLPELPLGNAPRTRGWEKCHGVSVVGPRRDNSQWHKERGGLKYWRWQWERRNNFPTFIDGSYPREREETVLSSEE